MSEEFDIHTTIGMNSGTSTNGKGKKEKYQYLIVIIIKQLTGSNNNKTVQHFILELFKTKYPPAQLLVDKFSFPDGKQP